MAIVSHTKKQLLLRKNEDKRILRGHLWVFSNEVKEIVGHPAPGDIVELRDNGGRFLGKGFFHPHSLIAFRLLTREDEAIDFAFFEKRIRTAWEMRKKLFPTSQTYRLIHGESDFLPGLVIDKYERYLALQTFSFGMEERLTLICDVLDSLFHPIAMVERNESPLRQLEDLPERKGILRGTIGPVLCEEAGVTYAVDLLEGQKTGLFLDQRENRIRLRRYAEGARALDAFCNDGGFALHLAQAGAQCAIGIDASGAAVTRANRNSQLSGVEKKCVFKQDDVFDYLEGAIQRGETYDLIVLDPPSFTKSRKALAGARRGYRQINTNAMKLLEPTGILATASCSHHLTREMFLDTLNESARRAGRSIQLLELHGAAADHPLLPAMPETEYLKFCILRVH